MRNPELVEGAAVALPIEAVEAVRSCFENTLFGYFIGNRLAFRLVENYVKNTWAKYGLKRLQLHENFFMFQFNTREGMDSVIENGPLLIRKVPLILNVWTPNIDLKKDVIKSASLWVKLHHVPIVAYSDIGLSLITTQLGRPLMLDTYTSNMCISSWGKNTYARALIEVSADEELKKSVIIAIPCGNGKGHSLAEIEIEYEWTPPRCASCKVFDHNNDKCPKNPTVVVNAMETEDGFTMVTRKKKKPVQKHKQIEGVRLTKPALNLQYRKVEKGETSKNNNKEKVHSNDGKSQENHKCYVCNRPWCLLGDFNATLYLEESTCSSSRMDVAMREFKECVDNIEVLDVPRMGLQNLDHSPSILCIPMVSKDKPKPFKFYNILSKHEKFQDTFREIWSMEISGFLMYRIVKKLKNMKKPLRILLFEKGNLHANVIRLRAELDQIQSSLDKDPFNFNLREQEAACVVDFNQALIVEEKFLKQKAKILWLKEGDSNSAYFYKTVKKRISRNRIDVVMNGDGVIFANETVPNAFVSHYEMFLGQAGISNGFDDSNLFKVCVNDQNALHMVRSVTDHEVKDAIFSMGDDKSPGPDGYTAAFFKDAWMIVGDKVTKDIREFFINGRSISDNILLTQELMHNYHLDRASIIKEGLDEFKDASGLTPSLPKSTAYFCNVLNHVKLSILNVLPFEEGHFPVKYLGVLLVSSRLMVRDCRELVEKVQNRVQDWRNKSLSIAGKAKVAWDVVCLPKEEGGLGIRRLEHFNSALMISHIWNLLTFKESLWVKWIHAYKLNRRNFWDDPLRGNISWGWHKILHLRPTIREFIWCKVGNDKNTSLWFDRWCPASPIANHVSNRDISRSGLTFTSCVHDIIVNVINCNGVLMMEREKISQFISLGIQDLPRKIQANGHITKARTLNVVLVLSYSKYQQRHLLSLGDNEYRNHNH
nr:zinc knuckle CX2CX4HX4C [Tanacetum cinerariifolium]